MYTRDPGGWFNISLTFFSVRLFSGGSLALI